MKDRTVSVDKGSEEIKQVFWQTGTNGQRPKLKIQINGIEIESLVDTGAEITIISLQYPETY